MAPQKHLLIFPHAQSDLLAALNGLTSRSKADPQLESFLLNSFSLIGELAESLNGFERGPISGCETITVLAERHISEGQQSTVVEVVLTTTIQVGQLLVALQDRPDIWSSSSVIGYGFGLMAAIVAAAARSVSDVAPMGLRVLSTAFKLAQQLERTGSDIEGSYDQWSGIVAADQSTDLQRRLDEFNKSVDSLRQAYIGQVFHDHVVVYGPPSTLASLFPHSDSAKYSSYQPPMFGSHLPPVDVTTALGESHSLDELTIQRPLYSAHAPNEPTRKITFGQVLQSAVVEIAHAPVNVMEALQSASIGLESAGADKVIIMTAGSMSESSSIQSMFAGSERQVHMENLVPEILQPKHDMDSISPDAVAVVGMSGRFPQSDSLDELWNLLQAGATTHQEVPSDRFCIDDFYDTSREKHNAVLARYGCFIKKPGDFDHRLFNISPREALQMDPVQRMLLMTTYEALEMAGYSPNGEDSPPRVATYFGQTVDDWKTVNMQQGIDTHFLPAVNRGFAPGRLCHYFRWSGGFYSIDTGCSSSATGICIARDALAAGNCDAAIVGGGTLLTSPEWYAGLSQGGFLSPTGACKTYSEDADGYCRGEAVAVVVLKRLKDVIRSKDNVLAVISGASRNTNAGEGSITHPGQHAQENLYRRVLAQAGVSPHAVDVVEMHGTGTQAGDRVESTAVHNVFVSGGSTRRSTPLTVGAIKANIGHSEAAAGVVSLIKAILMLQHNTIPPQPGLPIKLNPHLVPLFSSGMQIAKGQPFQRKGDSPRFVFINNFDAAGGNVSMLIQDLPTATPRQTHPQTNAWTYHAVSISGRTPVSLAANKDHLRQYISRHPGMHLGSLAYTTSARRMHQSNRDVYVASSVADLLRQMETPPPGPSVMPPASSVVFAFTGQGSQYLGMGRTLYQASKTFKQLLDSYQRICSALGLGCDFLSVIRGQDEKSLEDGLVLERNMQVATVAIEIALAKYWQRLGLQPTTLIGHSLGEFAALCIAGVMSVNDTLLLVHKRATLITTRITQSDAAMLAVALPASTAQWRIRDSATTTSCEICCINGPSSTVIGGPVAAIQALETTLRLEGVATTRLSTKYAFHTRQMDAMVADLQSAASKVRFHPPKFTVASTLLGRIVRPGEEGIFCADYIRRHTREPVKFHDSIRACEAEGLIRDQGFIVEIGPHPVCIGLIASSFDNGTLYSFPSLHRKRDDCETVAQCMAAAYKAQLPVCWKAFHQDHLDTVRLISDLPTYAFENEIFWHSYRTETTPLSGAMSAAASRLPYTSLHTVEDLHREDQKLMAVFKADTADHHLRQAITGHVVDGVAICPASIFMEMAYSATQYLHTKTESNQDFSQASYQLMDLKMNSPLVLRPEDDAPPMVLLEAILDLLTGNVKILFRSMKDERTFPVDHGSCSIILDKPIEHTWPRMKSLVESRMNSLNTSPRPSEVYAFNRKLFYKSFSGIVDYDSIYHAVDEALIATNFADASIVLQLSQEKEVGKFACNPFAVDAIVHVAGFLLNADVHKPKDEVHIANNIGSFCILGDLSLHKPCRAYATIRQRDQKSGISVCDVYVVDGQDQLVAMCTDICFKKLDRDFFSMLTGSNRASRSKPRTPKMAEIDSEMAYAISSSTASSSGSSTAQSSVSSVVDLSDELLLAVAKRTGVSVVELHKSSDMTFADMGVDSQMSIQILADFQKSTAVELPAAFFTNFPTPAAVEQEMGFQPLEADEGRKAKPQARPLSPLKDTTPKKAPGKLSPSQKLMSFVAKALGVKADAFTPATTFESLGMDSMLSIKIISSFQKDTGIELPAAFFSDYRTVSAAQKELDDPAEDIQPEVQQSSPPSKVDRPAASLPLSSSRQQRFEDAVSRPVLIQGRSKSQDAPLFMTTDGSGTVESYIHLSALPNGRKIYALESPFLEASEYLDFSIQEMANIFIRSIRKIQPHGPYLIGGWSAGSIYAYEVANRLATQGEIIQELVILDMRAPSLIPTSIVTTEFVDKLGTFEGINRARDLPHELSAQERKHLMATCRALSQYDAPQFPHGRRPRHSTVVWARLGLDAREDAPKAAMHRPQVDMGKALDKITLDEYEHYFNSWFYGRREEFGTNGWEDFLGDNISVYNVDGDHFSMMTPPLSAAVGSIVSNAVGEAFNEGETRQ